MRRVRPEEIAALLERAADCPAELFRRYRYRDPARVDSERIAELMRIDLAGCGHCRAHGWPCADHRPRLEGVGSAESS